MTITIIAAVAANGVIGAGNDIPWRVPGDQKRAKNMTMGHVLVMGRKTFETIGKPLPGRITIVVTRDPTWPGEGIHVVASIDEALHLARALDDDIFVFGGAEIYTQTLPIADRLEITEVHSSPAGDTHFPDVDWSQWRETSREDHDGFAYVTYHRS
jgi:dihydrofolate reductase